MILPIDAKKLEIVETIIRNDVVIIAAETGAGKSTRIPQWLAEEGYSVVVTQPRIIAAESVAMQVAKNMNVRLGEEVGYSSSEKSLCSRKTICHFVTDGLAVQQLISGHNRPDILIIDEVHEWNLNIEVLVAFAKSNNLKVVLMSATSDTEALLTYFGKGEIVSVSGRMFPVTRSHRGSKEMVSTISSLVRRGEHVLVFLPGKGEIAKVHEDLLKDLGDFDCDILPLHSQLQAPERNLIFTDPVSPRVILSTNIAQTSLTIPYITAVVDSGLENRMVFENGVNRLIVADVSRADLSQRAGRAGRVRPGSYILCSDVTEREREEFPIAEIQRGNLENTYLKLLSYGIRMEDVEFFHAPEHSKVVHAIASLKVLGCINDGEITDLGRKVSKMPLSVRNSLMMIRAEALGVLPEITSIVAIAEVGDLRIKKGPWRLHTKESKSDMIALLDVFNKFTNMPSDKDKSWFETCKSQGVHAGNLKKARIVRENVIDACRGFITHNKQVRNESDVRANILSCIREGYKDSVYSRHGWSGYVKMTDLIEVRYGLSISKARNIDNESVVNGMPNMVVGIPLTISGRNKANRPFEIHLLTMVTSID